MKTYNEYNSNDFFSMRFKNQVFDRANSYYGLEYRFYFMKTIEQKNIDNKVNEEEILEQS
jgi:hypothetical protein